MKFKMCSKSLKLVISGVLNLHKIILALFETWFILHVEMFLEQKVYLGPVAPIHQLIGEE